MFGPGFAFAWTFIIQGEKSLNNILSMKSIVQNGGLVRLQVLLLWMLLILKFITFTISMLMQIMAWLNKLAGNAR